MFSRADTKHACPLIHTGYSSVGRASDCRHMQQSDGPWFDSGWPDFFRHSVSDTARQATCGVRLQASAHISTMAQRVKRRKLPQRVMSPCIKVDTLGIEPRASRMLSGCDTTTPCAPWQTARKSYHPDDTLSASALSSAGTTHAELQVRIRYSLAG